MKKSRKITLFTGLAVIILIGIIFLLHKKKPAPPVIGPTLVELSAVTVSDIPLTVTAAGNLAANQQTNISPKVGGYVSKILFNEGDFVNAGTLLIQLDNEKEQNDLSAAKADADLSALQYERENKAYKKGLILQDDVYNAKVTNEKNQAVVKTDQTALDDMALTAPFSGLLGSKNVNVGDYVSPGQKLITLVDQKNLRVEYALPSQYAPQLQIGQATTITADFLPGKQFSAKVNFISPYIDTDSQTITVHAVLNNESGDLKPGQFVNITQTLGTLSRAILVPENSVLASMNGYYVFTVKNNHVVSIPVKIGERIDSKVQITAGLKPTDNIITTGQNVVKDNDPVNITPTQKTTSR